MDSLMDRLDSGLKVEMHYDQEKDEVIIAVEDLRKDLKFEIRPGKEMALDAFMHPFAYFKEGENATQER
jgi:hypothetical protein